MNTGLDYYSAHDDLNTELFNPNLFPSTVERQNLNVRFGKLNLVQFEIVRFGSFGSLDRSV